MMAITYNRLARTMNKLGHVFFEGDDYDLNLIGIRSIDAHSNRFNDLVCAVYKAGGLTHVHAFAATTDPGVYYRNNPLNVKGTAIMKAGQYRGLWKLGKHQGRYDALVQQAPVTVYRDADKDDELDQAMEATGHFGINLHRASAHGTSKQVDKWSAGCQVLACNTDFDLLMALCRKSEEKWGNSFSYTLINEDDLLV